MSDQSPEDRGIAAAQVDAQVRYVDTALKDPCSNCPCAKGPSVVSRVGRRLVSVLHDKRVDTELKKLIPILVLRAVVYAGGSVEAAKLIAQALKAAGV